jgi:hypothetical protein
MAWCAPMAGPVRGSGAPAINCAGEWAAGRQHVDCAANRGVATTARLARNAGRAQAWSAPRWWRRAWEKRKLKTASNSVVR